MLYMFPLLNFPSDISYKAYPMFLYMLFYISCEKPISHQKKRTAAL